MTMKHGRLTAVRKNDHRQNHHHNTTAQCCAAENLIFTSLTTSKTTSVAKNTLFSKPVEMEGIFRDAQKRGNPRTSAAVVLSAVSGTHWGTLFEDIVAGWGRNLCSL